MKTARFLGWIATHLGFIGRFIEARDCDSDAVLLWRSLVAENPDSHTPNLANQLGNLGIRLSNLNRHEESLGATEESITLYRSLVEKNLSQLATGCVTCHACHGCVTDFRPILGNPVEVTHVTSPGHVYIFPC